MNYEKNIMSLRACGYKVNGCRLRRLGALQNAVRKYGIRSVNERLMELGRYHPVMLCDIDAIVPEPDGGYDCYLHKYGYGVKKSQYKRLRAIFKAMEKHGPRVVGDRLMMLGLFHPVMIEDLEEASALAEIY